MAESPTATVAEAAPPAPASITSLAELDVRMAAIKASPTAVADEASPVQGDAPSDQAPQPAPDRPAEPEQGDVPEEGDGEQPKPGGRFARLRDQLTTAETRARDIEQQLHQRTASEQDAMRQFVDLVLPDATFEVLRQRAEGGDWEAKQQIDQARTWRRMVAPIADLAHRSAKQMFDAELAQLRTLDGMDGDTHQKLMGAPSPGEQLKLTWQLARKSADAEHRERISALEAEIATLKTNKAANGSQPAAGGGRASNGSAALAGMLGSDGLPTEEAIQRARMGEFRNLGVSP